MTGRLKTYGWLFVLALLAACGLAVSFGNVDNRFDFTAAMEMWGDIVRDVEHPAYQLTRVSSQEEMALGRRLSNMLPRDPGNTGWERYVEAVGGRVAQQARRGGMAYQFHVSDAPYANAWALPGGQIYITVRMLEFLETEAELAAILGHEVAHVDLYHCVERYQLELAARRIGVPEAGQLADLAHVLVRATYQQYQELDADSTGVMLAARASYDPAAAQMVFARMRGAPSTRRTGAPVPELARATAEALQQFLASHPTNPEREQRLHALLDRNGALLRGKRLYVGWRNYQQKTPRSMNPIPDEWIAY